MGRTGTLMAISCPDERMFIHSAFNLSTLTLVSILDGKIPPPSELNMFTRLSLGCNLFRRPPFRTFEPSLSLPPKDVCHLRKRGIVTAR